MIDVLEGNRRYLNLNPKCEPQLGRRGLYRTIGGDDAGRSRELALLWVLNLSDGEHGLLDIAERSGTYVRPRRRSRAGHGTQGTVARAPGAIAHHGTCRIW